MPLIHIQTSAAAPADPTPLLQELSRQLASLLGKPERTVMALLNGGMAMTFAGEPGACAYVEIKSIGALGGDRPDQISAAICALLERHLSLSPERITIGFEDVPGRLWGWNGGTFA